MYAVLRPKYEKTGDVTVTPEGTIHWQRVRFEHLGYANDMADALVKFPRGKKYGYSHVLEHVGRVH